MKQTSRQNKRTSLVLLVLLVLTAVVSISYGAIDISLKEAFRSVNQTLRHTEPLPLNERIFMAIRLPRVLLCMIVGACLAVGGSLLQALFRNPIVEPGLIGTSSGAAFGAALYFVLGAMFQIQAGEWILPIAACCGAVCSTLPVLLLAPAAYKGKTSITSLLLTGIAINALFMSGVGFLSYIARDPQARSITLWGLGTLSGANWHSVSITGVSTVICLIIAMRFGKSLNALSLGEEQAQMLGVRVKQLKRNVLILNVVMVGIATAFVGVISFVGLIVPHLLRMVSGSDNRALIRNSALLGAILLSLADVAARLIVRPAELPIGIVTSIVGAPLFIFLLRKKNYSF